MVPFNGNQRIRRLSAKKINIRRREHSFTALDRIYCSLFLRASCAFFILHNMCLIEAQKYSNKETFILLIAGFRTFTLYFFRKYILRRTIEVDIMWKKLNKIARKRITIEDLVDENIPTNFRFHNRDQLRRLFICFRFPNILTSENGAIFSGQEVFLSGLFRLHVPNRFCDESWQTIFGFDSQSATKCFNLFLVFMMNNWSYLLFDHLQFWSPYLKSCSIAIRDKLATINCEFPHPDEPNGFCISGFLDNTIIATSRVGSGSLEDEEGSARKNPLIQQTWYNGWKKVHGIKYQTFDLPNGMNAQVYGPLSCRRHDLFVLNESNLNEKLFQLQRNEFLQFKIYGDSAYIHIHQSHIRAKHHNILNSEREIFENLSMSACRQSVEWNYGQLKNMWKFIDYEKNLKLLSMPVVPMTVSAMILRNASVTLNGNITSSYYHYPPPSLEEWTGAGLRILRPEDI